jgi:hypothetical protein
MWNAVTYSNQTLACQCMRCWGVCSLRTCCYIWLLLCQLRASHASYTLPEAAVQLAAVVPQQLADIVAVAGLAFNLQHLNRHKHGV